MFQLLRDFANDLRAGEAEAWLAAVMVVLAAIWVAFLVVKFGVL